MSWPTVRPLASAVSASSRICQLGSKSESSAISVESGLRKKAFSIVPVMFMAKAPAVVGGEGAVKHSKGNANCIRARRYSITYYLSKEYVESA